MPLVSGRACIGVISSAHPVRGHFTVEHEELLTLIAGIWGMNFKHMPELDLELGYPIAIAMMIAVDVVLYLWFKKIRWL